MFEGQMGQVSFQCENSAQREGAGACGQRGEESFFKEDCIGSSGIGALDFCCESSNAIDMVTVCSVT